ncbi:hypothetical protein CYMTET_3096 [Cymbomonas tetramitiformis]|uniref:Uncharacterized protein n=1 Tax=Cymbomonas tetramitiformis TaxID=36881 RepID=A0AAE0H413_9CHLO|nr:hypothetical protein CYMTET_3096 [Cymbomonas tetramitiformis]
MCANDSDAHDWQRDVAIFFILVVVLFGATRLRHLAGCLNWRTLRTCCDDEEHVVDTVPSACASIVCVAVLVFYIVAYNAPCDLPVNGTQHTLFLFGAQALLLCGAHCRSVHARLEDHSVTILITHPLILQARAREFAHDDCLAMSATRTASPRGNGCVHMSAISTIVCVASAVHLIRCARKTRASSTCDSIDAARDDNAYTVVLALLTAQLIGAIGTVASPCCYDRDGEAAGDWQTVARVCYATQDALVVAAARVLHTMRL